MTRILFVFAILLFSGMTADAAQAACPECQQIADRLQYMESELRRAEGIEREARARLAELENTGVRGRPYDRAQSALKQAVSDVDRVGTTVLELGARLRECQRACRRKQRRPWGPKDPIDETIPRPACKECEAIVTRITELQEQRRYARDDLAEADERVTQLEARMKTEMSMFLFGEGLSLVSEQAAARDRLAHVEEQIAQAIEELSACNRRCHGLEPPKTTNAIPDPPMTPAKPAVCQPCQEAASELAEAEHMRQFMQDQLKHHAEREAAKQAANDANQTRLGELRAQGQGGSDEARRLEDAIKAHENELKFGHPQYGPNPLPEIHRRQIEEYDKQIPELRRKLEECEKQCKPTQTSGLFRSPWPYVGGAGVAVATLIGGGGGSTPLATATSSPQAPSAPVSSQPQPQPPPAPQPPADPVPTIDGDYACTACSVASDNGRHDLFILLCRVLSSLFPVRQGSISISHPAPFVSISGDFNTTTGAFTATGRGTVAGFPNVSVRGDGTADARTGRITFDYTMGAGGELPGGQPIVYRISLQKQR